MRGHFVSNLARVCSRMHPRLLGSVCVMSPVRFLGSRHATRSHRICGRGSPSRIGVALRHAVERPRTGVVWKTALRTRRVAGKASCEAWAPRQRELVCCRCTSTCLGVSSGKSTLSNDMLAVTEHGTEASARQDIGTSTNLAGLDLNRLQAN